MLEIYKFDPEAKTPTKAHYQDAGWDLYSIENFSLLPGETKAIDTGIAIHIPNGSVGLVQERSGMALKGFAVGGGVIDAGYNGRIAVILRNVGTKAFSFGKHEKIAQLVVQKVDTTGLMETRILWESKRGSKGFGSSDSCQNTNEKKI